MNKRMLTKFAIAISRIKCSIQRGTLAQTIGNLLDGKNFDWEIWNAICNV